MTSDKARPARHWVCIINSRYTGRGATRQRAMNIADKPYRHGFATIKHDNTGETWERRQGIWFKVDPGPVRDEQVAA